MVLNFLLELLLFLLAVTSVVMGFGSIVDTSTARDKLDGAMEQWLHIIVFFCIGAVFWWWILPYKKYVRDTESSD